MNTKGQQIGCKHRQMEAAACGATGVAVRHVYTWKLYGWQMLRLKMLLISWQRMGTIHCIFSYDSLATY